MRAYSYHGIEKIKMYFLQFIGLLGILFFTAFAFIFWIGIFYVKPENMNANLLDDARLTFLCLGLWCLGVAWVTGSSMINFLPSIWTDDEGVTISAFIFLKLKVNWENIIDVGQGHPPRGYTLVRTRRLTIFHSFYGWLYSYSLYPSFLIGPGINDPQGLIGEIRRRRIVRPR